MRCQRVWWPVSVLLAVVSTGASAASIEPLEAGGGLFAAFTAVGPDFVARRAWVSDAQGNGDGVASRGEVVSLNVSVRNSGFADAVGVRTQLSLDDPDADMWSGSAWRGTWSVGNTRTYGHNISMATRATPHDVKTLLTITADNGGPWRFVVTFSIAAAPLEFVKIDTWIDDP